MTEKEVLQSLKELLQEKIKDKKLEKTMEEQIASMSVLNAEFVESLSEAISKKVGEEISKLQIQVPKIETPIIPEIIIPPINVPEPKVTVNVEKSDPPIIPPFPDIEIPTIDTKKLETLFDKLLKKNEDIEVSVDLKLE